MYKDDVGIRFNNYIGEEFEGDEHILPKKIRGKLITGAKYCNEDESLPRLYIYFSDGSNLRLQEQGIQCCESRYFTFDDEIDDLLGGNIVDIILKSYKSEEDGRDEIVFVEIVTSNCSFNFCAHNDHNGYYSGLSIYLAYEGKEI